MIKYRGGAFGFQVLLRLHGSAMAKAMIPSLISTLFYVLFFHIFELHDDDNRIFDHPYPMGALIASFTFLLTFKTSFSYGRYWEAVTVVYQMHSKWLDVGTELAAFHLQSSRYRHPPAFGEFPEATSVKRERERLNEMSRLDLEQHLETLHVEPSFRDRMSKYFFGKRGVSGSSAAKRLGKQKRPVQSINAPRPIKTQVKRHHKLLGTGLLNSNNSRTSNLPQSKGRSIIRSLVQTKEFDPSLFLQEGAHLISLLSAVALSTLRNDLEEAESPLSKFEPGAPWPHVDPDEYSSAVRSDWEYASRFVVVLRYLFGYTRTSRNRTLYNAARPFRVIGGVSDVEIKQLQRARGPLAKVALCTMWLQEFISREHLQGGMGRVAAPIISRLFQFTSDGMLGYNQARKIAYIPFPFPHAQITSLYVVVMVVFIPVLMLSYVNNEVFGALLTFFTVLSFAGLYEVSRELENPFKNVPNDIPLNNFQAQFNEALMTMFNGYHPDAWWVVEEEPLPSLSARSSSLKEEDEEDDGVMKEEPLPTSSASGTREEEDAATEEAPLPILKSSGLKKEEAVLDGEPLPRWNMKTIQERSEENLTTVVEEESLNSLILNREEDDVAGEESLSLHSTSTNGE